MKGSLSASIWVALILMWSSGLAAADDPAPASSPAAPSGQASTSTPRGPDVREPAESCSAGELSRAAGDLPVGVPPAGEPAPAAQPPTSGPVGTVTGRLVDGDTQEGLPAAAIQVLGGPPAVAELDGTYALALPPGTYTIVFSTPEYVEQRRTVAVTASQTVALDVVLAPAPRTGAAETIEVHGTIDTRKDSAVLAERRASVTVSDAISAQQIARSPDSNASDAAKRIVSATIQDNRYLVIRGLGGRYSTTLLNGFLLPSPDPDIPAAPLDLFPASLITNLTVDKTFAPDMPGNFAGGALGIETRNYPSRFLFKAKIGVAGNSISSFRTLNGQRGGSLDLLGYDDGTRSLPAAISGAGTAGAAQAASFQNNWSVQRGTVGPNLSLGATVGDSRSVSGTPLGYFGSVSFSHGYASRLAHVAQVGEDDGHGGKLPSVLQLDDRQGIEQANLGALAGAGWTPASGHKLDLFTLYAHTGDITSSQVSGVDRSTSVVDRTRLDFLQRELMFAQLVGDDRLAEHAALEWQANVAHVAQHEPDTRELLRIQTPDDRYAIVTGPGGAERVFSDLGDTTLGFAAAVRVPLDTVKLKAGASIQRSARDYQARRFLFNFSGDTAFLPPDRAFDPGNTQLSIRESTQPSDGYTATRTVAGAYAMADVNATDKLRLIGGARLELSHLEVGLGSGILGPASTPPTTQDDLDPLPSLSAVYAITPSTNLRAAYAMTIARANFRELAPALYYDYVRRRVIGGNPNLDETKIHSGDLRWEMFLGDSELLAASVFAKHFVKPIEKTVETAGDGDNIGFENAISANSYGVELEARLSLGRLVPVLAPLSVNGNVSLIGSRIELDRGARRPLQGQSPYVANLALGYEHPRYHTRLDLAYNTFGRRIEEVGTAGSGDVYEEPFQRLDLTAAQPLSRNLLLKLAGSNLLDQQVLRTQDGVETFAYRIGITVLGSIEYSLE